MFGRLGSVAYNGLDVGVALTAVTNCNYTHFTLSINDANLAQACEGAHHRSLKKSHPTRPRTDVRYPGVGSCGGRDTRGRAFPPAIRAGSSGFMPTPVDQQGEAGLRPCRGAALSEHPDISGFFGRSASTRLDDR